ncbi:helix-turn-helix domain-containing protein [Flavobacterium rakeshii]|uniref:Helix-turn-helix domain-containing protein n=1 Tax=Flavobacterium rakeshii TaxID=1038845 RepID=A0A6N8HFR8_9FLAO|nr:helix-turn-helix transcriptional regulator [Flavobacterium rakeshii]MUV04562.1 helix-turn-helix domain-containing protein [Flavobacterium rakeshii]
MSFTKSLEAFYNNKFNTSSPSSHNGDGDFNVFDLSETINNRLPSPYARYDFFKIMIIHGEHRCHYADKSITFNGNTLLFFNPIVPYRFEILEKNATGFFCVFKEPFFSENYRGRIQDLPMFTPGGKHVYDLNNIQDKEVTLLFEKMLHENNSDYQFKYDLLRNYVSELIHFAGKLEPNEKLYNHPDANARITSIFINLLESQFPIQSPENNIKLRSAGDYASRLGLHVNHLNRAIKLTTGKTTTTHIANRIVIEASALLKHTKWDIAEISYCLGFAQPSHFTYFFKKHTGNTPSSIRFV